MRLLDRKHILYIDYLDVFSFICAVVLRPFFRKIYYHHYSTIFNNEKSLWLRSLSLEKITYKGRPCSVRIRSFPHSFTLGECAFKNVLAACSMYQLIKKHFAFDSLGQMRLDATIKRVLSETEQEEGPVSIPLMEEIFKEEKGKIIYMPSKFLNYLLLKEWDNKNVRITLFHCWPRSIFNGISIIKKIIMHRIRNSTEKNNSSNKSASKFSTADHKPLDNYQFAFFPHLAVTYGVFFKKNYFYEGDPSSFFYKENVLTLFLGFSEPSALTKRYLRLYKIPFKDLKTLYCFPAEIKEAFGALRKLNVFAFLKDMRSMRRLYSDFLTLILFMKINRSVRALKEISNLKVIYVDYDTIFPPELLLACHLRGIQTVSSQARILHYPFFQNIFFDHYCIGGEKFKEIFQRHRFHIGQFHNVGLVRANFINRKVNPERYKKYIELKKDYTLVVCFGVFVIKDRQIELEGEAGGSLSSNRDFIEACLYLAKKFPRHYFLFRFKIDQDVDEVLEGDLKRRVLATPNFEIMSDIKKHNSYAMAHLADIVIGKGSSIMDECFSQKRKIIFYDNEDCMKALDYILNDLDINKNSFEELAEKIKEISDGNYLEPNRWDQIIRDYYMPDKQLDPYSEIKKVVLSCVN